MDANNAIESQHNECRAYKDQFSFFCLQLEFSTYISNQEKVFLKGVLAYVYASLDCGALSVECTAEPNILGQLLIS